MRVLALLVASSVAAVANAARSTIASSALQTETFEIKGTESPIVRVVTLLKEMKAQLEKDASTDGSSFEKMTCWCETNEKAKTQAVADADASLRELQTEIETRSAKFGELEVRIEQTKKELAELREAADKAEALREKERSEYMDQQSETTQAVAMLKNAVTVLGRNHAGLLQMTPAVRESMGAAMRWAALKHEELLALKQEARGQAKVKASAALPNQATALLSMAASSLSKEDAQLARLLTREEDGFPLSAAARTLAKAAGSGGALVQGPAHLQAYAPQSGQIFGILKQMQEDFEKNLSEAEEAEKRAAEEYAELKKANDERYAAGASALDDMEEEFGSNGKALADAKEDMKATQEQRGADVAFLRDLKVKCQDLERQMAKRTAARGEEIKAVSAAISMLTEEDARDLFNKKLGESFLQKRLVSRKARNARAQAAAVLMKASQQQDPDVGGLYQAWRGSSQEEKPKLAALAVSAQLDAFTKVKKAIDDMLEELKKQQQEEVEHKAECTKELNDNEKMTFESKTELRDIGDRIAALEEAIAKAQEGIKAAQEETSRMQIEIKKAGENREQENKAFQEEVSDQRAMQNLLTKVMARLKQVYKEALVQQEPATPPVQFQPYKQNQGGKSVLVLMESIVEDSKKAEDAAVAEESEAQKDYESMVKDSNEVMDRLAASITEKKEASAAAAVEKEEATAQQGNVQSKLQDLAEYASDLHKQCDFLLKNFEVRQKARTQEMEALQTAKALLSGMDADDES